MIKLKNEKGITLIILVVTIIVVLILSGITISAITGGESAIDKANEAKLSTEVKAEKEEIQKKIDTSASRAVRYGNYSGSADAKTIQGELKNLVIDTSMITGNGPWQVTGTKTGTKYLIKQSYEVIPMPENTGTKTEMGVKEGDYVNYKAGNWTQEDIDNLKNLYSGEKIPDSTTPYTFGGFKVGQSKDIGITKGENNESIQDNEHAGWRVLKINEDGSINIIHAGCPEYYYHPTYYKNATNENARKNTYRSLYILGDGKSQEVAEDAYEGVFEKDWKVYENSEFCINKSAHCVTVEELLGPYRGPISAWYRYAGATFWVREGYPSGGGIFIAANHNGSMLNYGRNKSYGIRPVLTLKPECLFQNTNDENIQTHDTQETAWNLVI